MVNKFGKVLGYERTFGRQTLKSSRTSYCYLTNQIIKKKGYGLKVSRKTFYQTQCIFAYIFMRV